MVNSNSNSNKINNKISNSNINNINNKTSMMIIHKTTTNSSSNSSNNCNSNNINKSDNYPKKKFVDVSTPPPAAWCVPKRNASWVSSIISHTRHVLRYSIDPR